MDLTLTPGTFVRHPACPEWGTGQIQSAVGHRVTVNFEHRGKVVLDLRHVELERVEPEAAPFSRDES